MGLEGKGTIPSHFSLVTEAHMVEVPTRVSKGKGQTHVQRSLTSPKG